MALAKGKKRYQFSLNESNVERLKKLYEKCGYPENAVSALIDELIEDQIRGFLDSKFIIRKKGHTYLFSH